MSEKLAKKVFIEVPKRRRVTGTVDTGETKKALYTGRFTAHSIIVSNNSTSSVWFEIYDGDTLIIGRRTLAANSTWEITDCDMVFYTSVGFNSDVTTTVFTSGGFVP
jgi:hypothetical protein